MEDQSQRSLGERFRQIANRGNEDMKILKLAAIPALALAASAFTFAPSAYTAAKPSVQVCARNCGAIIKITGVIISSGNYPTEINVTTLAKFSKAGTRVADIRLFVDKLPVPENMPAQGSTYFNGDAAVIYGSLTIGLGAPSYDGAPFTVTPGKHVLTTEVIGVGGAVFATSAPYTVTASAAS